MLYISWFDNRTGTVHIHGPVETVECSTRTYYGTLQIIDLLRRVKMYAEIFLPWMERSIL